MKKLLLILFISMLPLATFASEEKGDKVKYDKQTEMLIVNGEITIRIVRDGCGLGVPDCHFDVYDLDGKKVIRVNYYTYNDPAERKESNPEGKVHYLEWIHLESDERAETQMMTLGPKQIGKAILANDLMPEWKLSDENFSEFAQVKGTRFSRDSGRIIKVISN